MEANRKGEETNKKESEEENKIRSKKLENGDIY